MFRNSPTNYGWIGVFLHWSMALLLIGLFAMGLWMVELGYYDSWYHRAPELHKSLGLLVLVMWVFRLVWRLIDRLPEHEAALTVWEQRLATAMHRLFYGLIFLIVFAGYLMSTGENAGINFFGLFEVPAILTAFENQTDVAGWIHWALAWFLMLCVLLHSAAAFQHHFIRRDRTMLKILGPKR